MNFIEVTDPEDPRITEYRDIQERDLVGRRELFVAEGEVVLAALVRSRDFRARSLLLARGRERKLAPLLGALPAGIPVYVADQAVMDVITGFHIHRGILAVAARTDALEAGALLAGAPDNALLVVAVGIGNHDNVGAIFRNAAAFGASGVLLDETCCDPLYRKALRVSVGAVLQTPFARVAAGDIPRLLESHGFQAIALSPSGAERLADVPATGRIALLLGAEGPGLPADLLAASRAVRIEMRAGFDSLNVATAGAIALHHFARVGA